MEFSGSSWTDLCIAALLARILLVVNNIITIGTVCVNMTNPTLCFSSVSYSSICTLKAFERNFFIYLFIFFSGWGHEWEMLNYPAECDTPAHAARTRPGLRPAPDTGNSPYQSSAAELTPVWHKPCDSLPSPELPISSVYTPLSGAAPARSAHTLLPQLPIYGSARHPQHRGGARPLGLNRGDDFTLGSRRADGASACPRSRAGTQGTTSRSPRPGDTAGTNGGDPRDNPQG